MQGIRCLVLLVVVACRGPELSLPGREDDGEPVPESDERREAGSGEGGAASPVDESLAAEGGAATAPGDCSAQLITLEELHSGQVREGVAVSLPELVASSQKFLVSEAKSGSCLWGAFAASPERVGAGSGLFLVSFGPAHESGVPCASGADGLPDDLAPGDRLAVQGFLAEYAPSDCAGTTVAQPQLRVDAACPARRVGLGSAPEAELITPALADQLAAGRDPKLLRDYAGALVELASVSAVQDPDDGDAVFPFGAVRLMETALELRSRLYYFDLSEGGPRAAAKATAFAFPTQFERVRGVVFLDYCTWGLGPRDRCADLAPSSSGCSGQARGP